MNQWPDGWSDGSRDRSGTRPAPPTQQPGVPPQSRGGHDRYSDYGSGYDSGYSNGQVYSSRGRRQPGDDGYGDGPGDYGPYDGRPRPNWGRRIKIGSVVVVLVVLAWSIGTYFWADGRLQRTVDLSIVQDRPQAGDGTNYLIVGSDSREGMSKKQQRDLHTGGAAGKRTDSMILLHVGSNGTTAVSLPRDSWVTIPPFTGTSGKHYNTYTHNKLNAAYAEDGGSLLVRTVEYNTGLKIDHYAEIGFGGFAQIVDAVGGVDMDIKKPFKDHYSGADFQAGEQTLNGKQALAYVRTRHAFGASDLDRTKNQQKFLSALANQTATPSTVLNPFRLYPTLSAGLDTLDVDKDMSLWNLGSMFFGMKDISGGDGKQINMPTTQAPAPMGSLNWDKPKMKDLMNKLRNDDPVDASDYE